MKTLVLYFDGGNAKGVATWAVIAKSEGEVLAKLTGFVDKSLPQTNNVAEWYALYMAAVYTYTEKGLYQNFLFKGDSELIVKQARGEYAVSNPNLKELAKRTTSILLEIVSPGKTLDVVWIPREENTEADELGRTIR